jgi:hypothetical protein
VEAIMKIVKSLVLLPIVILLFTGCATSKFTQTGKIYPPYNGPVKGLSEAPKGKKYVEIGWISSSGGMIHEWTDLIEAIQKKAGAKGANAIILMQSDKNNSSMIT